MKTKLMTTLIAATFTVGAQAQTGPIRVGVVTPLSGTYAGIGQQVKWGLDLAAKEINTGGGVMGRQIELIYEDEEANPAVAVQKAEKLFQVGKVDFLTGTVNSGSTLAVGQVAERNNRLIATTVSFADSITSDKCSANVFRVNARAGMQSAALADWMAATKPNANVFYLGPDYDGSKHRCGLQVCCRGQGRQNGGVKSSHHWITRTTRHSSVRYVLPVRP
ncbi:ABC transporter substrate-binding protein [Candidatus Skiveiella danica]|uniref:ABC transporter substrate-binding protein n=1 Tax=Candidatus Skiveiella danica TaxID=3386177 RepID=UPI0039B8E543